ncbi:hypothetical protein VBApiPXC38_16 [Acinetobacter phage VB_ApiP_XC38]|uniref:DUF1653 domain-containing protein n=1 Tax=Acinetobacter phage VB_ApiP_XC38 TaxID=2655002 RepID=A0A5P8PR05_9CAUD|nr:hypothetical protein KNU81_gp16 [Acinetobacter phage VB_ApiP_XC38]QFR59703.1 hypothetical protein VBApiPXC38_16 [Acinetobacter phage VB_ApiP_XC38]
MTPDEIRAVLAPMYKGQIASFKTPDNLIDINFDGVNFNISIKDLIGRASGIDGTKSLKEAVRKVAQYYYPKHGQLYQHINGNIYTIMAIANEHSTRPEYPPTVVYRGENDLVWCKPLENFLRKMKRIK